MDYDEHLERALERAPEIDGDGDRFSVPGPAVRQEGRVTVYENFRETVDRLDRSADHLLKFLQTELGTSAGIDERGRARLTGTFGADRIRAVLDDYVDRFVRCPECGLPDTRLDREGGVEVIRCEACGARSAV